MPKRKNCASIDETAIDMVFERRSGTSRWRPICNLSQPIETSDVERESVISKSRDFTLEKEIETFESKYSSAVSIASISEFLWAIDDSVESIFQ
jgi:hypothetical protein